MKRSHYQNGSYGYNPTPVGQMEEQNDELTSRLREKVAQLKGLTTDMGHAVRMQNEMLEEMDTDFGKSGNILERSMRRLGLVSRGSQGYHLLILGAFCFLIFVALWIILKFR